MPFWFTKWEKVEEWMVGGENLPADTSDPRS